MELYKKLYKPYQRFKKTMPNNNLILHIITLNIFVIEDLVELLFDVDKKSWTVFF